MRLPKVKSLTEKQGLILVNDAVTNKLEWLFREQPTDDYGIDAHMEVVKDSQATGRLIALQIKAGDSYLKEETAEGFVYRGKIEHLNYWTNHQLPVVLVLCDVSKKVCYWVHITEDKVEKISDDSWKVIVPKTQILGWRSSRALELIGENQSPYERKFQALVLAKYFIEQLEIGNDVYLEGQDWVNKSSGQGYIKLMVVDRTTGESGHEMTWPYIRMNPFTFSQSFEKFFPWADLSVDEEYYADYDYDEWLLDETIYNSMTGENIINGLDYEEWKKQLPKIRPYIISAGEAAEYRLKASLNELGKAFLIVDRYLRS